MKEVNFKEFIELPIGTLYSQYGPLCIKGENINNIDFFYEQVTPWMEVSDTFGVGKTRWAEFDYNSKFITYEEDDIPELMTKLLEVYLYGDKNE